MRSQWAVVCGVVAIVLFAVAAVTYLTVLGQSVADVVGLLAAIGAPTIASLLALAKGEQSQKTIESAQKSIETVKTQTNGKMAALDDRVSAVENVLPDTPAPGTTP